MNRADLRSYVSRSRSILETDPPETVDEIRSWLVEPFLAALGWDVHAPACETDATVRDRSVDYLCSVENTPAVAVLVRSSPAAVDDAETPVRRLMAATGIDRAVVTDGRTFVLYAGADGSDRVRCSLDTLLETADALERLSEPRCRRRLERHSRSLAARRLAVRRSALASEIATDLADVAGHGYADEFERAAKGFVTDVVSSLLEPAAGDSATPRPNGTGRATSHPQPDGSRPAADSRPDDGTRDGDRTGPSTAVDSLEPSSHRSSTDRCAESPASAGARGSAETTDAPQPPESSGRTGSTDSDRQEDATPGTGESRSAESKADDGEPERDDGESASSEGEGDGEYVVRFFNERGSIGAIGHSRSDAAMVLAVEYCLERGLSGVRLPWEHDDATVINDGPVRADGSPMSTPRELSNGWVLEAAGDLETRAERIRAIASRAGLRAMLTGDWPDDGDR